MNQKQEIILRHYRQGHGKKKIARDLKVNIKTVRRYLAEYERRVKTLENGEGKEAEALLLSYAGLQISSLSWDERP